MLWSLRLIAVIALDEAASIIPVPFAEIYLNLIGFPATLDS